MNIMVYYIFYYICFINSQFVSSKLFTLTRELYLTTQLSLYFTRLIHSEGFRVRWKPCKSSSAQMLYIFDIWVRFNGEQKLKFMYNHIVTCWGCAWLIRRALDWMIGFIAPYAFTTRDYRQHSALGDLHTLMFTVIHALGFSVFTSRILATDL
jgi:hypothetical protein